MTNEIQDDVGTPLSIKDKMAIREGFLNEYERGLQIPSNQSPGTDAELQSYLNMDKVVIESLDRESAIAISIRLAQYSIYIQRCVNTEKGRIRWAESEINKMVAHQYNQFDQFIKHDIRRAMICNQDSAAFEYQKIITFAEQRCDRLNEIAQGVKNLGYIFSLLYKNKNSDYKERV